MEIIENKPYEEGPFGSGQYTYKVRAVYIHPSYNLFIRPSILWSLHSSIYLMISSFIYPSYDLFIHLPILWIRISSFIHPSYDFFIHPPIPSFIHSSSPQVYHIGRHIPSWFRSIVPKTALEVHEESWNAYPCTKTKFSVPFVEKFILEVDTVFQSDNGNQVRIFLHCLTSFSFPFPFLVSLFLNV